MKLMVILKSPQDYLFPHRSRKFILLFQLKIKKRQGVADTLIKLCDKILKLYY